MNDTPTQFPAIRHVRPDDRGGHQTLLAWFSADDKEGPFCGHTYCHGECGLPALTLPAIGLYGERKARNSYGACCAVFGAWRVSHWNGAKVEVPEEHRATCETLMWW